jgi:phasin family protein
MASRIPPAGGKKPVKKATTGVVVPEAAPAPTPVVSSPVVADPVPAVETVMETARVAIETGTDAAIAATEAGPQPVEDITPQIADTASKGTAIMDSTIDKTQTMFAELNDRAKAQVEKNNRMVAEATEFAKGNVEALVESGKIAAKGLETMGQDAAEYSRKSFENATATLKSMSAVKSPADFFKLQSDYVRTAFDSMVAETSKNTEAMIKLAGDAAQPISSRLAVAVEKVKTTA